MSEDKAITIHRGLQWLNTILLSVVGFLGIQTYKVIASDHEKIATHETRITVAEKDIINNSTALNFLTGRIEVISDQANKRERNYYEK